MKRREGQKRKPGFLVVKYNLPESLTDRALRETMRLFAPKNQECVARNRRPA